MNWEFEYITEILNSSQLMFQDLASGTTTSEVLLPSGLFDEMERSRGAVTSMKMDRKALFDCVNQWLAVKFERMLVGTCKGMMLLLLGVSSPHSTRLSRLARPRSPSQERALFFRSIEKKSVARFFDWRRSSAEKLFQEDGADQSGLCMKSRKCSLWSGVSLSEHIAAAKSGETHTDKSHVNHCYYRQPGIVGRGGGHIGNMVQGADAEYPVPEAKRGAEDGQRKGGHNGEPGSQACSWICSDEGEGESYEHPDRRDFGQSLSENIGERDIDSADRGDQTDEKAANEQGYGWPEQSDERVAGKIGGT